MCDAAFHKQNCELLYQSCTYKPRILLPRQRKAGMLCTLLGTSLLYPACAARALFAALWGPSCHESYQGFLAHLAYYIMFVSVSGKPAIRTMFSYRAHAWGICTYLHTNIFFLFSTIVDISLWLSVRVQRGQHRAIRVNWCIAFLCIIIAPQLSGFYSLLCAEQARCCKQLQLGNCLATGYLHVTVARNGFVHYLPDNRDGNGCRPSQHHHIIRVDLGCVGCTHLRMLGTVLVACSSVLAHTLTAPSASNFVSTFCTVSIQLAHACLGMFVSIVTSHMLCGKGTPKEREILLCFATLQSSHVQHENTCYRRFFLWYLLYCPKVKRIALFLSRSMYCTTQVLVDSYRCVM